MKIKLLNDAGYVGLDCVEFPVILDACKAGSLYYIHRHDLWNVGARQEFFHIDGDPLWPFPESVIEVIS